MIKFNKNTISLILLLLSTIAVFFLFIYPTISNIKSTQTTLRQKQLDLKNSTEKYEALKKASNNNNEMKVIETKILSLYPDDKDVSNFIINLENLAGNEKLTLTNLTISEPKTTAKKSDIDTSSIKFDFNTEGTYAQVTDIVQKLENFSRINSISSLNLSTQNVDTISLKVSGLIYYGK